MALCDDKRFILSHIRHSFITCDDTGMCETVILNENDNRYPYESIYHHPIQFDHSEDEFDNLSLNSLPLDFDNFKYTDAELELLKQTEIKHESELVDDDQPPQSLDIMSESYGMGIRRRSNTAQRLEKLEKETKNLSKTKVIKWNGPKLVILKNDNDDFIQFKRVVTDLENLAPEEIKLLEFDEDNNVYYETEEFRKYLFPKKDLSKKVTFDENINEDELEEGKSKENKPTTRRKSILTLQIEQSPLTPANPFNEYTRFDGRVSDQNAHTKRMRIFFNINETNFGKSTKPICSSSDMKCGPNWIEVVVLAHARVCDLIGLICWHYTHLEIGPPLKSDISAYALKIAEENGDVINDFPSLKSTDDISRYGFPCLALISVETDIFVTVYIDSENVFSQLKFESPNNTLNDVVEQIKKKRQHIFKKKPSLFNVPNFYLARSSLPNEELKLNLPLSDFIDKERKVEFILKFRNQFEVVTFIDEKRSELSTPGTSKQGIRLNKSSSALANLDRTPSSTGSAKKKNRDPNDFSSNMFDIMKAPLYQCFEVIAIHKLNHCLVEMGISETKLEISPKPNARHSSKHITDFFSRFQPFKALNINIEDVVECHLVPLSKSVSGKQLFKIVYWHGNEFKSIKFEGDQSTVDDIIFKLQHVMKMCTSDRRNEYNNTLKSCKKNSSTKIQLKSKLNSDSNELDKQ